MHIEINKPLKLESALNIRELGGYSTTQGRVTKKGVFLRGDSTHSLTPGDLDILINLGVTLVVDLRSPDEVKNLPSKFYSVENIQYENVPMFDGLASFFATGKMPGSMAELYCWLLDNCQEQYKRIFRMFLNNRGISLFHCTAGKDRTGVVAMLLLQMAGVPDDIIIRDYAVSEENLKIVFDEQSQILRKSGIEVPKYVLGSKPEDMEKTLCYLKEKYNGAFNYLLKCGLTKEELGKLIDKFVD